MNEKEGVIKFNLDYKTGPLPKYISLSEINAWRTLLFKLQLIGQIEGRYLGYGFGNISQRLNSTDTENRAFIISGTQTGGIESLSRHHYSCVLSADPLNNVISATGEIKPSSEALTHASVYQQNPLIGSVIHIHSPIIWKNTHQLNISYTSADIAYGTPAMANEVKRLLQVEQAQTNIFSMLGHEDGIIAYSDSMEKSANLIIKYFVEAIALEQKHR